MTRWHYNQQYNVWELWRECTDAWEEEHRGDRMVFGFTREAIDNAKGTFAELSRLVEQISGYPLPEGAREQYDEAHVEHKVVPLDAKVNGWRCRGCGKSFVVDSGYALCPNRTRSAA